MFSYDWRTLEDTIPMHLYIWSHADRVHRSVQVSLELLRQGVPGDGPPLYLFGGGAAAGVGSAVVPVGGGAVENAVLVRVDGLDFNFDKLGLDGGGMDAFFVEHFLDLFSENHVVLQITAPKTRK